MKMKLVNVGDLQARRSFCDTRFSRTQLEQILDETGNGYIPIFDYRGVANAIADLPQRERSLPSLINDIKTIFDTFFYPSCLLSMVVLDEEGVPEKNLNALLRSGLSRTLDDWTSGGVDSVLQYVLNMPLDMAFLNVSDVTGITRDDSFWLIPRSILNIKFEQISVDDFLALFDPLGRPSLFEYDPLLHKELAQKIDDRDVDTAPVSSAMIAPLRFNNKTLGAIMIGTTTIYNFSPYTGIFELNNLHPLIRLFDSISLSLYNILYNPAK